ncbi:MAG: hypothetical protein SGILL_010223, partial [Bacillariaceae sp.]
DGKGDIVVPKTACSVFTSTNLDYTLRNLFVEQLVIVGQLTEQCVESAVRDAADLGYFVTVVEDACATHSKERHEQGLKGMKGFCRILTTMELVKEMKLDVDAENESGGNGHADKKQKHTNSEEHTLRDTINYQPNDTPPMTFNSDSDNSSSSSAAAAVESAYTKALLRSLNQCGVKFLRYMTVDPYNTIRSKAVPIQHILKKAGNKPLSLDKKCGIAEVCNGGLASYADLMVEGTGLSAVNSSWIKADAASLRILPYANKTAIVMGNYHNQYTDEVSPYCTRSLLSKLVKAAADEHNIAFNVGAELEFCLVDAKTGKFVDQSVFGTTTTLNEQEDFITTLYEQCQQQDLPIELVHAESAGGQVEVVLEYSENPVDFCDAIVLTKETVKAVAHQFGYKTLFLPKFDMMKAGNGLHLHLSVRDAATGQSIFADGSALSETGSAFVEGILQHLPAITGLTLPTVNSHRRIAKGCWTGSVVGWALEDKESSIRVCSNFSSKEWDHVECKIVDSTANPYLAVGALLQSGLSGIAKKAILRPSLHEVAEAPAQPSTLAEALDALETDDLLTKTFMGGKLTKAYLAVRRHELKRSLKMNLEEEVAEASA